MNEGHPVVRTPALLIAAPASGQGKTTVACALARLHSRAGRRVRVFKCGPDFLDPHWLQIASGSPVDSLDLWINGEADCRARLFAAASEADLVIVEGVMGLFDGDPSAADLAQRFDLPVLAVVDASAMAGTFGAMAHGLHSYRDDLPWAGVLANRVAGERHAGMLQAGLREPADWLGALMRDAAVTLPERHLGLVAAGEVKDALERLDAAADALATTPLGQLDIASLRERWSVDWSAPPPVEPVPPLLQGRTVAIARDAAFAFIYPANVETLRALGAEVVFFSPLAGGRLPPCDAVWLPGGYPELHVDALAANAALAADLRAHVSRGGRVHAECGGMMALFDALVTTDGSEHAAWGLLPGHTVMQQRLAALGPLQWALPAGTLRGHTFHHSTCDTPLAPVAHTTRPDGARGEAVYALGPITAGYFHAWFPSCPAAVASLFTP